MIDQDRVTVFTWADVASVLLAERGITEGLWFVGVGLHFAGSTNEWTDVNRTKSFMPTGLVGVGNVVLAPADAPGPMVFDAAKLVGKEVGVPAFRVPAGTDPAVTAKKARAARKLHGPVKKAAPRPPPPPARKR